MISTAWMLNDRISSYSMNTHYNRVSGSLSHRVQISKKTHRNFNELNFQKISYKNSIEVWLLSYYLISCLNRQSNLESACKKAFTTAIVKKMMKEITALLKLSRNSI